MNLLLYCGYGLSRSEQQLFLKEFFNFSISKGTVFNKQKIVSAAMQAPADELLPIVKAAHCVHSSVMELSPQRRYNPGNYIDPFGSMVLHEIQTLTFRP